MSRNTNSISTEVEQIIKQRNSQKPNRGRKVQSMKPETCYEFSHIDQSGMSAVLSVEGENLFSVKPKFLKLNVECCKIKALLSLLYLILYLFSLNNLIVDFTFAQNFAILFQWPPVKEFR